MQSLFIKRHGQKQAWVDNNNRYGVGKTKSLENLGTQQLSRQG